jgi:hypothetical protein
MTSSNANKEALASVNQSSAGSEVKVAEVSPKAKEKLRRNVTGPEEGFGPLWSKTYAVQLNRPELSPAEVIKQWKANFSKFWPNGNYFFEPLTGLSQGDIALVQSEVVGGLTLSTGLVVVQDNPHSFTLLTAKGHVFTGKITFLAREVANGTVAEVRLLMRSADPLIELAMLTVGHDMEDTFWYTTLTNLARYFGIRSRVGRKVVCLNPGINWRRASNIAYNPLWNMAFDLVEDPFSFVGKASRQTTVTVSRG